MKAGSKLRNGYRRSCRLAGSIQKLNCTLPKCKGPVDHQQNSEEDENPYFFPVFFPESFEQDMNTLNETHNSSSANRTQYHHESSQTLPGIHPSVRRHIIVKKEDSVATTKSVAASNCSQIRLRSEPQPRLPFDDERYTYSPEPPLDEERPPPKLLPNGAPMEPRLNFDDDLCGCDGHFPDPPISRIRTDESFGVPLVIQFAKGEREECAEIALNYCREQTFLSTSHDATEDTVSTRTPLGHYHEEENDSSRDQPSLSSKRSRQSRIQQHRRIASYTSQDCETYTPVECSPSTSCEITRITDNNNFHFEFEEPPMHRCFRMKSSPGDSKPTSYILSNDRQKMTLSGKLDEVLKPVPVRGASVSIITTRSGATEVTVATTQSTSSMGSRASSSGIRVLDLIQPFDRLNLDRGLTDSSSTITPLSIPPMLRQEIAFGLNDSRRAPPELCPQNVMYPQYPREVCLLPEESIDMVETSFDTIYSDIDEDQYYYEG